MYKVLTVSTFIKSMNKLKKKYPHIKEDIEKAIRILETFPKMGIPIPGYNEKIWKIRVGSRDIRRGKRGGYRLIYFWTKRSRDLYLLFVYAKSGKVNITKAEIEELLEKLSDSVLLNRE